jgi:hypothetical protein
MSVLRGISERRSWVVNVATSCLGVLGFKSWHEYRLSRMRCSWFSSELDLELFSLFQTFMLKFRMRRFNLPIVTFLSVGIIWHEFTNVSEVCTASIVRALSLHGSTTQKTATFNTSDVCSSVMCWTYSDRLFISFLSCFISSRLYHVVYWMYKGVSEGKIWSLFYENQERMIHVVESSWVSLYSLSSSDST